MLSLQPINSIKAGFAMIAFNKMLSLFSQLLKNSINSFKQLVRKRQRKKNKATRKMKKNRNFRIPYLLTKKDKSILK
jgi:hypothetical protein